jgi:hypothetical protein
VETVARDEMACIFSKTDLMFNNGGGGCNFVNTVAGDRNCISKAQYAAMG